MRFSENRKQKRLPQKPIVVFYHADCTDGFTAGWAAWKKFGSKADYIPYFHEDELPELKGKQIYTLDMTFPENKTRSLMENNQLTGIDHHISMKEITLMTHKPLYDIKHSGCVLTWKYFFQDKPVPYFLQYVEDRDIWLNKFPDSRAFYAYLELSDFDFKKWTKLISDFESIEKRKKILEEGKLLLKHEDKVIEHNINENSHLVDFEGYTVYAINTNYAIDVTGARLARLRRPFSIVWQVSKDGRIKVSLRGVGNIDCSEIAKKYGGGGHKYSAGFRLDSKKDIPWKLIKI